MSAPVPRCVTARESRVSGARLWLWLSFMMVARTRTRRQTSVPSVYSRVSAMGCFELHRNNQRNIRIAPTASTSSIAATNALFSCGGITRRFLDAKRCQRRHGCGTDR